MATYINKETIMATYTCGRARHRRMMSAKLCWLVLLLSISGLPGRAQSGQANPNPGISPPQSRPHGLSYGAWSALWWKWALEQPAALSPLTDTTGVNCAVGQSGSVWFLAGTQGGSVKRTCAIPAGKALFFPVANYFASAEGTFDEMQAVAKANVDLATNLSVIIDQQPVRDLRRYRAQSPDFTLELPDGNIFDAPAGSYSPSAADGYYLMLAPLTPGTHTIHIYAEFPEAIIIDVTYVLSVGH